MPAESRFGRSGRSLWGERDWRLQIIAVRNGSFRNGMFYATNVEGAFINCVLQWASNLSLNKYLTTTTSTTKKSIGILSHNTQLYESIWQASKPKAWVQHNWCQILAKQMDKVCASYQTRVHIWILNITVTYRPPKIKQMMLDI